MKPQPIITVNGHADATPSADGQDLAITPHGDGPIVATVATADGARVYRYDPATGWSEIELGAAEGADRPPPSYH